jgi:hypothetical protein
MSPELFREAGTDPPCEQEFVFVVVPDEQSTKILAAALRKCVSADYKLLLLRKFDFEPGGAAPAGFVERIRSFCC